MEVEDLRTGEVVVKGEVGEVVSYSGYWKIFLNNAYSIKIDEATFKRLLASHLRLKIE